MRSFTFAVVLLAAISNLVASDDPSSASTPGDSPSANTPSEAEPELGPGSPAPALMVDQWLKGDAVTEFAADRIYVLEFWATWCGPCIKAMPHLDRLARKFKDKGLVVVAITTEDPGNSAENVAKFVLDKGSNYDFRFAFCSNNLTWSAYMDAAQQQGIPCSFVVGKDGKIAYVGNPQDLDDVLPLVIAGTWRGRADAEEYARVNKELESVPARIEDDSAGVLATLDRIASKYPGKAASSQFALFRLIALLATKKFDEAEATATSQIEKLVEIQDAEGLAVLGSILANRQRNSDPKFVALGLATVDKAIDLDGNSIIVLLMASRAYFGAGNLEKAIEVGEKAIAVSPDEVKGALTEMVKQFKNVQSQDQK